MPEMSDVVFEETIEEEWGNDIRDRTVQRYDSVATRTSEHGTPTAGDLSYLEDTGDVDVYHSGAWRHLGSPVATVEMLAGGSVPTGWLLCNGQAVSRTTYAALFSAIGTAWGSGDGSTTFNVPDLRGRVPRGVAASGDGDELGDEFGSDTHQHTINPPADTTGAVSDHDHTGTTDNNLEKMGMDSETGEPFTQFAQPDHFHGIDPDGGHDHDFDIPAFFSANSFVYPVAAAALHFIIKT